MPTPPCLAAAGTQNVNWTITAEKSQVFVMVANASVVTNACPLMNTREWRARMPVHTQGVPLAVSLHGLPAASQRLPCSVTRRVRLPASLEGCCASHTVLLERVSAGAVCLEGLLCSGPVRLRSRSTRLAVAPSLLPVHRCSFTYDLSRNPDADELLLITAGPSFPNQASPATQAPRRWPGRERPALLGPRPAL